MGRILGLMAGLVFSEGMNGWVRMSKAEKRSHVVD